MAKRPVTGRASDPPSEAGVEGEVPPRAWRATLRFEPRTESSQDVALGWRGAPELSVVISGEQTRAKPHWPKTPPGTALEASWVLYPSGVAREYLPLLVLTAALALWRALVDRGIAAELYWPNQVRIGGRLVGAVRTDSHGVGEPVALGLGAFVGLTADQIPSTHTTRITSLSIAGSPVDRLEVLVRFGERFSGLYEELQHDKGAMLERYRAACATLGRRVRVDGPSPAPEGVAVAIGDDGHLILDTGADVTELVTVLDPPGTHGGRLSGRARKVSLCLLGLSALSVSGLACRRHLRRGLAAARSHR